MTKSNLKYLIAFVVIVAILLAAGITTASWGPSTHMQDCADCEASGVVENDGGETVSCESCAGSGQISQDSDLYATFWALIPPIIAIALALITKEVYSSLFIGILVGALFYSNFNIVGTVDSIITQGFIASLADGWNAGIYLFLVILGVMVALINVSGGAVAFGRWAEKNIKTRIGAMLETFRNIN